MVDNQNNIFNQMKEVDNILRDIVKKMIKQLYPQIILREKIDVFCDDVLIPEIRNTVKTGISRYIYEKTSEKIDYLFAAENRPAKGENVDPFDIDEKDNSTESSSVPVISEVQSRLISILNRQNEDERIKEITGKLQKSDLNRDLVKELLDIYYRYYNHPSDPISKELEGVLRDLKNFNIRINHANKNLPSQTAVSFEIVKKNYMANKLTPSEMAKVRDRKSVV